MTQSPLSDVQNPPEIDVKGQSAIHGKAPWSLRIFAAFTDLFWVTFLYWLGVRFLDFSPLVGFWDSIIWNSAIVLAIVFQIRLLRGTIGQRLWGLEKNIRIRDILKPPHIRQAQSKSQNLFGWAGLCLSILLTIGIFRASFFGHPIFQKANELSLPHYIPKQAAQQNWVTLPFFYTLGAWPKSFSTRLDQAFGRPILYTIPYAKGPPKKFPGKIIARWELPDISMIIEGPKTPIALNDLNLIKMCITQFERLPFPALVQCAEMREKILHRHLSELKRIDPRQFKMRWLEVANPYIQTREWVRGIFLSAIGKRRSQDRMILITPNGAHQTIILNRPSSQRGELALRLFKQILGTLRVSSQLKYGRALVNQKLSQTKIKSLKPTKDPYRFMNRISEIHALLLSKISVDPKNFDAYYHLGGTSYLMMQEAIKLQKASRKDSDLNLAQRIDEWTASVKPMIQSSYLFARDIAPDHPNTDRLHSIWLEVQKL